MKLHHTAIWVNNIEKVKEYYINFLDATSNELYVNPTTGFCSYFLSFGSGGQIEIMHRADVPDNLNDIVGKQHKGLIHLAFAVDSKEEVDSKAKLLRDAGYPILRGPRVTGDGYYEFESIDVEGNRFEVIFK